MSIKDRLDEDPEQAEAWRPETVGQELIGTITRINERKTDEYPEPYPVVTVRDDQGVSHAFHAFHSVAKNALLEQGAGVGCEIGARYLGKVQGASFAYHNYRIVIEKPVGEQESIAATQQAREQEHEAVATQQAQVATSDEEIPF